MISFFRYVLTSATGVLILGILVGCGDGLPPRRPTFPVSGVVQKGGKPVAGAHVIFWPTDDDAKFPFRPHGKTGDDGAFKLSTYLTEDGAPAGDYDVTVTLPKKRKKSEDDDADTDLTYDAFGGRYSKKGQGSFRVTVNKSATKVAAFELK